VFCFGLIQWLALLPLLLLLPQPPDADVPIGKDDTEKR
jgi:hypothetical protein